MSDQMKLSQAEIDALFRQHEQSLPAGMPNQDMLDEEERDVLGEIGNITFGSASTALSTLLQQRVEITTPTVNVYRAEDLQSELPQPYVLVCVDYTAGLKGTNTLAIELQDAKMIADLMLGGDGSNLDGELHELHLSAVAEAMNQMMGGAATSMSNIFTTTINISPPSVRCVEASATEQLELGLMGDVACVSFRLRVGDMIESTLMQLLPVEFAKQMVALLRTQTAATAEASSQGGMYKDYSLASLSGSKDDFESQRVQSGFADFPATSYAGWPSSSNLPLLLEVGLSVSVELGRTRRPIREILKMSPGSVIELDKLAGEPVDILVNNHRVAMGEVVVIDESLGVRVTKIVTPGDRVKHLQ